MLNNLTDIGMRIKQLREEKGLKQINLAVKAKIEVSSLSRYENGKQAPNLESIVAIAQALNVSLDYLVFGDQNKKIELFKSNEGYFDAQICKSLAELIERNAISFIDLGEENDSNLYYFVFNKNRKIDEFFDKMTGLAKIKNNFGSLIEYEKAKDNLIKEYAALIYYEYEQSKILY